MSFSSSITLDTIEPTCNITLTNKRIEQTQEKVDLKITGTDINLAENAYSFDNNTYSNAYIKTLTDDGNYKAYVKDKANNIGYCSKLVYIDRKNPTITTNIEKQNGSVKVNVTLEDNEGVVAYQEGTNSSYSSNWNTFDSVKTKKLTLTKTTVGTYYVYAKDEYGHITKGSYEVKASDLDSEKPKITVTGNSSSSLTVTITDNVGVVGYKITTTPTTPTEKEWTKIDSKTSISQTFNNLSSSTTYYIHAIDEAGNTSYTQATTKTATIIIYNPDPDPTPSKPTNPQTGGGNTGGTTKPGGNTGGSGSSGGGGCISPGGVNHCPGLQIN